MVHFQIKRSRRHNFLTKFSNLTRSCGINLYLSNIKFQQKLFTSKKVIQLWNFGIPEIIPKSPVTLGFSKVSLRGPKGRCKCFQMRYWLNFYVDPTYSNSYIFKVSKRPVFMQATVLRQRKVKLFWSYYFKLLNSYECM